MLLKGLDQKSDFVGLVLVDIKTLEIVSPPGLLTVTALARQSEGHEGGSGLTLGSGCYLDPGDVALARLGEIKQLSQLRNG